jgi:hypothetical protein
MLMSKHFVVGSYPVQIMKHVLDSEALLSHVPLGSLPCHFQSPPACCTSQLGQTL